MISRCLLTCVNILNHYARSLICEEPSCFRPNALPTASYDCYLARKKTLRVVEVLRDLLETLRSHYGLICDDAQ